jgi:tetratricopeptide (TPR) repeat protein
MNSLTRLFNERAINLARGGAAHNARLILTELLANDPRDVVTRLNLAWVYENQRQPHEAEKHYRAAVAIDPQHEGARDALDLFEARQTNPCKESSPPPETYFPLYTGFDGSALWDELHAEIEPTPKKFEAIVARVSCGVCTRHTTDLLIDHKIDFNSLDAYRRSTVAFHNAVSRDIGKAEMKYEDVAALRGW